MAEIDNTMEIWKAVVGYEGRYTVSSLGRVRGPHRILKAVPRKQDGRLMVSLHKDGIQRVAMVHLLVVRAFLGSHPEGKEPDHVDGNPQNNATSNFEFVTHQENMQRAVRLGKCPRIWGIAARRQRITDTDIPIILQRLRNGDTMTAIAKDYGVCKTAIHKIKIGQNFKHIAR